METVNIEFTGNQDGYQQYEAKDLNLLNTVTISNPFGTDQDYIEYFIYDLNGNLLASNYFVESYTPVNPDPETGTYTSIQVDPEGDVKAEGYTRGTVNITYNFFRKLFNSDITKTFWIKEISGDRTELRVCRQDLSNIDLEQAFIDYTDLASLKAYYPDFYLNFANDNIIIGVNVLYALQDDEGSLLIKLYEPLPDDIELKDNFWIVDKLSNSANYTVNIEVPVEVEVDQNTLRGPNYNVDLIEKVGQTTPLYNYSTIFQTSLSASYQQLKSLMEEKSLDINVDYSDFSNFVHFSSATERIYNFAYKLQQIENYTNDIVALQNVPGNASILSSSKEILQNNINTIIEKFDGYEYYLYYTTASTAWPKSGSYQPYKLYSVTSSQALNWLGSPETEPTATSYSILYSASLYDVNNPNALNNTIPAYLKEDGDNQPYQTFLSMIGQHFDNIWIYLKDVTERYDAENNLDKGISKDLVGDALRALGIKLYTNTSISDNLYYSLLAINPNGSLVPPTGSELIKYYIPFSANSQYVRAGYTSASYTDDPTLGSTIPGDDITKEYYKRLYHNVPYLLKTRGTMRGLRALINCFGIPDTVLRVNEFGGSDKLQATPDLVQRRHSLAYLNTGSAYLALPWAGQGYYFLTQGSTTVVPDTIEFRFKSKGIPATSHRSQSLIDKSFTNSSNPLFRLQLTYSTSSAVPSSSYQYYGDLRLIIANSATTYTSSLPISLPFFDPNQWWQIMIKREVGGATTNTVSNRYWVYAKSAIYDEEGNATIGFEGSQSLYANGATTVGRYMNTSWIGTTTQPYIVNLGKSITATGENFFQGYYQEFRYWGTPLSESVFDEHVISSTSYRGNNTTGSLYGLTFRLPLGSNLNVPYTTTANVTTNPKDYDLYELGISEIEANTVLRSYHPAVTGTFVLPGTNQVVTSVGSFIQNSRYYSYGIFSGSNNQLFEPFEITDLIPTPSTGVNQKVNNKVSVAAENDLAENLLSPHISIQKYDPSVSKNSADIEVGFAPSDVLDLDISNQLGYFNADEYIGNPTDAYSSSYQSLDNLRDTYFTKYTPQYYTWWTSKYNIADFIRLIKYYDNSLFKMIKDFVPARANLSTGIIVKPHILERSKYPRNEPIVTNEADWSGSINMVSISGSNPEDTPPVQTPCARYTIEDLGGGGYAIYEPCTPLGPTKTIVALGGNTYEFFVRPGTTPQDFGDVQVDFTGIVQTGTYYPSSLNTSYTSSITTPLGTVTSIQTDLSQPFTGDFGGNEIEGASNYFSQTEVSSITAPWTSSIATPECNTYYLDNVTDILPYTYVTCPAGIIASGTISPGQTLTICTPPGGLQIDTSEVDVSLIATGCSRISSRIYTTYSIDPLENNASANDKSTYRLAVDYSSNPNVPVNLGLITASLALYPVSPGYRSCTSYTISNTFGSALAFSYVSCPSLNTVTVTVPDNASTTVCAASRPTLDPGGELDLTIGSAGCNRIPVGNAWPSAEVNDYNWETFARTSPRYLGAEMVGLDYNVYSTASQTWPGDQSYGKTPVINKLKPKYAYLVNVYTASFTLPGRANAQIKYLIDNDSNTLNLTKANQNIFDVQNIFKTGESVQVALFNFNPDNPDVQVLTNNQTLRLYEGGFRYSPTLYNTTAAPTLTYQLNTPIPVTSPSQTTVYSAINAGEPNYWFNPYVFSYNPIVGTPNLYRFNLQLNNIYNVGGTSTRAVTVPLRLIIEEQASGPQGPQVQTQVYPLTVTIPAGTPAPFIWSQAVQLGSPLTGGENISISIGDSYSNTFELAATVVSTVQTSYTTALVDNSPDWLAVDNYTIKLSSTQSLYYEQLIQTASDARVEVPVFPICANVGDKIKLYTVSSNWGEVEEYTIASSRTISDSTGSFRYITVDRPLNPAVTTTGEIPAFINRYISLKHVPDETNLILRYAPTIPILQEGLAIPQYIDPVVQANAGNIVQTLKSNNLI